MDASQVNLARRGGDLEANLTQVIQPSPAASRISCVLCAYNEADRIQNILEAVTGHPMLAELGMISDALSVLSPWGVLSQNLALRRLSYRAPTR